MITLEFEVEGKSLRLTSQQILTSGSTNVDEVKFVFDSSWDDFSVKTAIFYKNKTKCYVRILEDDGCIVPSEVLASSGYLFIGVRGTNEDKNVNSEVVKYKIEEGALENAPDDPTMGYTSIKNDLTLKLVVVLVLLAVGYTSIKNDLTLKHEIDYVTQEIGYTSIKNDLTLKRLGPDRRLPACYTSIKNDLTLKHHVSIA